MLPTANGDSSLAKIEVAYAFEAEGTEFYPCCHLDAFSGMACSKGMTLKCSAALDFLQYLQMGNCW